MKEIQTASGKILCIKVPESASGKLSELTDKDCEEFVYYEGFAGTYYNYLYDSNKEKYDSNYGLTAKESFMSLLQSEGVDTSKEHLIVKMFPNGFISWYETFYEVVANITFWREGVSLPKRIKTVQEEQGTGGLYELAKELTDKFELLHKDREWDGDFFDEIDKFLDIEFNT